MERSGSNDSMREQVVPGKFFTISKGREREAPQCRICRPINRLNQGIIDVLPERQHWKIDVASDSILSSNCHAFSHFIPFLENLAVRWRR